MRSAWVLAGLVALAPACGTTPYGEERTSDGGAGPVPDPKGEDRTDANITISPADIDFGDLPCGTESPAKLLSIKNAGRTSAPYRVAFPEETAFRVEGALEGIVPAEGLVTLKLFAKPFGVGESATDVVVSAGNAVQSLHPKARGTGATLEFLPSVVDFGDVRMQNGAGPVDIEVANKGTAAVALSSFAQSADFTVATDTTPLTIQPGTKALLHAKLTAGFESAGVLSATLAPTLATSLCGATPSLTLRGKRVNSNVTLSSGDWGKQNCTAQLTKDITVSNYSATALNFTASLANGAASAFTILSGASGTIPVGTTVTPTTFVIKLQPKPFGSNLVVVRDDLGIDITNLAAPDGGLRKLPLQADVRGAIVNISPASISTFLSNGITTDTKTFTATNSGNEKIFLTWSFARTLGGPAWTYSPPNSIAPGATATGSVGFKPSAAGPHEAKLTPVRAVDLFNNGAVACTPLGAVSVQGAKF